LFVKAIIKVTDFLALIFVSSITTMLMD